MGDVFKEQIVKRQQTSKDVAKRIGLIIGAILIFLIAQALIPAISVIIGTAALFGALFISSFLKAEYEYVFTNGELDIDVIYNRSRRKRAFSCYVNNVEIMAHLEDTTHMGEFHRAQETRDYSSGVVGPDTYAFLINHGGKYLKVIIEPNEKMMAALKTAVPRTKLHLKK